MDTRKLTSRAGYAPHDQALIYDETTSVGVAVTYGDQGGQTAAELVRRWNAFPKLVKALRVLSEDAFNVSANGNLDISEALDPATIHARNLLNTLNQ